MRFLTEDMVREVLKVMKETERDAFFSRHLHFYVFADYDPDECRLDVWSDMGTSSCVYPSDAYGILVYSVSYQCTDPTDFSPSFVEDVLDEVDLPDSVKESIGDAYEDSFVPLRDIQAAFPEAYQKVESQLIDDMIDAAVPDCWDDYIRRLDDTLAEVYDDDDEEG